MPKKYAVAFISFFDNDLELHIVEAESWQAALEAAKPGYSENVGDDIKAAKEEAFNQDWLFNVKEITS